FGHDGLQEKCGYDGSGQLSDPVEKDVHGADTLGDPKTDGDRGIEVAAGDMAERGDHDGDGEAVSDGDAEQSERTGAVQELIGTDGPSAKENQSKRSDEFGGELLKDGVHREASESEGEL